MENSIAFFVLDDDDIVVDTLMSLIRKIYPDSDIFTANDGESAWNLLATHNKPGIILADITLPKLIGTQLIQSVRARDAIKSSYIILLTNPLDREDNLKGLKYGADDLLIKPVAIDDFIARMRVASKILNFQKNINDQKVQIEGLNKEILNDIQKMKEIVYKFQDARLLNIQKKVARIVESTLWVANKISELKEPDTETLDFAARMCFVGKTILPDKYIDEPVTKSGMITNQSMMSVPQFSRELLSLIRGQEETANILAHIYENFDGSGYPDRLIGWQIPTGSRIIRIALDFEEYLSQVRGDYNATIDYLFHESKRLYDFRAVAWFDQYLASKSISNSKMRERPVKIRELSSGLIISRNIIVESGIVILGRGSEVEEEHIDKLNIMSRSDPIIGNIYVYTK